MSNNNEPKRYAGGCLREVLDPGWDMLFHCANCGLESLGNDSGPEYLHQSFFTRERSDCAHNVVSIVLPHVTEMLGNLSRGRLQKPGRRFSLSPEHLRSGRGKNSIASNNSRKSTSTLLFSFGIQMTKARKDPNHMPRSSFAAASGRFTGDHPVGNTTHTSSTPARCCAESMETGSMT